MQNYRNWNIGELNSIQQAPRLKDSLVKGGFLKKCSDSLKKNLLETSAKCSMIEKLRQLWKWQQMKLLDCPEMRRLVLEQAQCFLLKWVVKAACRECHRKAECRLKKECHQKNHKRVIYWQHPQALAQQKRPQQWAADQQKAKCCPQQNEMMMALELILIN